VLDRITQLYNDVEENVLTTFKELDHYPHRRGGWYCGAWTKVEGKRPQWPDRTGTRIYAYLKPFSGLPHLLGLLRELDQPTVICCDGIDRATREAFAAPNLRLEDDRLDLEAVGRECALGILNGNHGTTIALLLAGKPSFHVPITLEQAMFAEAVRRLGAGLAASPARPTDVSKRLQQIINEDTQTRGANCFMARYSAFDPIDQQRKIVARIEELANCRKSGTR
jgi:UDP:flavonoid glycosyltransferase YjiC (YdhE family)